MQLEGATALERRLYDLCLRVEREVPASELATTIALALSEAGQELQCLRSEDAFCYACPHCSGAFRTADDLEAHVDGRH